MSKVAAKKKTARGRKPIRYSKEDLERQPMLMLVCGETGVGKTYRMVQEIKHYMKDNPDTGKKGRKVLIFDVNDDDYPSFRTVSPNHIKALTAIRARRIRPINKDGIPMDLTQKREVVEKILQHYRNGLLVLDDLDQYMVGAKGQSMIGALCTVRHIGLDIVIAHQSVSKITRTEFENCSWLRMHQQVDDITRPALRERIPKYHLVRIANLIVEEQYMKACQAFDQGLIDKEEWKKRKSFFVYVNMRQQKIRGCSKEAFIRACKKYIDTEEESQVRRMMKEKDLNGTLLNPERKQVMINLIEKYLRLYDSSWLSPMQQDVK
ncbi:MAG: hypothetical protein H6585_10020 [Flavobacteriales bacterium]|nr:hypothetical protein [Flavobacteriales bacterium]